MLFLVSEFKVIYLSNYLPPFLKRKGKCISTYLKKFFPEILIEEETIGPAKAVDRCSYES